MESIKYNRTYHLPWSKGATNDDKIAKSVESLLNRKLVITEKIDGSNTSLETKGCFARTHSGPPTHASFDGLKALHASIKHLIPNNLQIFGEYVWALHSISYDKLPGFFLAFNVRLLDANIWESWDMVEEWAKEIGVPTVPVLEKTIVKTSQELKEITEYLAYQPSVLGTIREGVVGRVADSIKDENFSQCVMKWVRKNHVNTDVHWKHKEIIKNKIKV